MNFDAAPDYPHETDRRTRTRLIHGVGRSRKWDYNHHVVPPISSSATFRLDSARRGAQAFVDLTATGTTLRENGLEIREEIATSTARLISNRVAHRVKAQAVDSIVEALRGG